MNVRKKKSSLVNKDRKTGNNNALMHTTHTQTYPSRDRGRLFLSFDSTFAVYSKPLSPQHRHPCLKHHAVTCRNIRCTHKREQEEYMTFSGYI